MAGVSIPTRLIDDPSFAQVFFDGGDFNYQDVEETRIELTTPGGGVKDDLYLKWDSGFEQTLWFHGAFIIPANFDEASAISPPNGTVKVQYLYTNQDLDLSVLGDRSILNAGLNGVFLDEASMQAVPDSQGRFRYLKFELDPDPGAKEVWIDDYSFSEAAQVPDFLQEEIRVILDAQPTNQRVDAFQGEERNIKFQFLSSDFTTPLDLAGLEVKMALVDANDPTIIIRVDTAVITDSDNGKAEVEWTPSITAGIPANNYNAEVAVNLSPILRRGFRLKMRPAAVSF